MYRIIQEIDDKAVITLYKVETTKNKYRIGIQVKEVLLHYTEAVPKYLVFIYDFFLNKRLNKKRLYSKFKILYNKDIDKVTIVVRDKMIDFKFYSK